MLLLGTIETETATASITLDAMESTILIVAFTAILPAVTVASNHINLYSMPVFLPAFDGQRNTLASLIVVPILRLSLICRSDRCSYSA